MLGGRMSIVESPVGTPLADHLRSTADAVEAIQRDECLKDKKGDIEGVSHAIVEWEGGDGIWTTVLVIE